MTLRVPYLQDPYPQYDARRHWEGIGQWPVQWVALPPSNGGPLVTAFRLVFSLPSPRTIRVHASADERYRLYLDGAPVGRGPERSSPDHWYFETYDLPLSAGSHTLVAQVWALGDSAPVAQMTARPGWLFAPDDMDLLPLLATGSAAWEVKGLPGYRFERQVINAYFVAGDRCEIDAAAFPWDFESGSGDGWQPAAPLEPAVSASTYRLTQAFHQLTPARLPAMLEEERRVGAVRLVEEYGLDLATPRPVQAANHLSAETAPWEALLRGGSAVQIPSNTTRRVIIDLQDYYCAYPHLLTSGGAGSRVRLGWAESLFCEPEARTKGNRGEVEGKYFYGVYDTFLPDGGPSRPFELLWWRAGRYLELLIRTAAEPLTIEDFCLSETRYPLEMESAFQSADPRLDVLTPLAIRALQMCSHETYMDCPYYEQLMYAGDTRLEALVTYAITRDERLPRKALTTFDISRIRSGLTQSRFPSRVMQVIPPFSLWWVGMVHDYALWRGDPAFLSTLLPGVRAVVEAFLGYRNEQGLVQAPQGWNFIDWATGWSHWGVPPDADLGVSGPINWQFAWILNQAAELEDWFGDPELAARDRRYSAQLAGDCTRAFWVEERGLFADDLAREGAHRHFSEHTQCLAVLSGQLDPARRDRVMDGLCTASDLTRTTIYFNHYLFETFRAARAFQPLFDRLGLWFSHDAIDMKTTLEQPEPSRSDCHAWGAHPVYHYFATFLGIRPAGPGFRSVRIEPLPGDIPALSGTLVHPNGEIRVAMIQADGKLRVEVHLPEALNGELVYAGEAHPLQPGIQTFEL